MVASVKITEQWHKVEVVNDADKKESLLSIDGYSLTFNNKADVKKFIDQIETAMKFWEYQ